MNIRDLSGHCMKRSRFFSAGLLGIFWFFTPISQAQEVEDACEQKIRFQDLQWCAPEGVRLKIDTYRGHESLSIQGTANSIARVEDVAFSSRRIEFDLAFAGRIPPWICFGVKDETEADKVRLNPWPKHRYPGNSRLYQAVFTKQQRNFLVLNYRQSSEEFDANRWVHVRIDLRQNRFRIFINQDRTPAIDVDNPMAGGTVGIQGSCYIRNLKIDQVVDGRNEVTPDLLEPEFKRINLNEANRGA